MLLTPGEVIAALGVVGGTIGFAVGLYRYHIAQKWKKSAAMTYEADIGKYGWQAVLYRDLFDYFFSYFERINHYIDIRLITVKDVSNLDYRKEHST